MPKIDHNEPDESQPFIIDGQLIARIHHDAGRVPYLLVVDESGNAWRVYGYAQVSLAGGGGGEWVPNHNALMRVIESRRKAQRAAQRAMDELDGIGKT